MPDVKEPTSQGTLQLRAAAEVAARKFGVNGPMRLVMVKNDVDTTFLAHTFKGPLAIKLISTSAPDVTEARQDDVARFETKLSRRGVTLAKPARTPDRKTAVQVPVGDETRVATVHEWMKVRDLTKRDVNPSTMRQLGTLMGRIHSARYRPQERPPDAHQWRASRVIKDMETAEPSPLNNDQTAKDLQSLGDQADEWRAENPELVWGHRDMIGDGFLENVVTDGERLGMIDFTFAREVDPHVELIRVGLAAAADQKNPQLFAHLIAGYMEGGGDVSTLPHSVAAYEIDMLTHAADQRLHGREISPNDPFSELNDADFGEMLHEKAVDPQQLVNPGCKLVMDGAQMIHEGNVIDGSSPGYDALTTDITVDSTTLTQTASVADTMTLTIAPEGM